MAVASPVESPAVAAVRSGLESLLHRARQIKSAQAVNPPLRTAELVEPVKQLGRDELETKSEAHAQNVLETAARDIFYTLVRSTDIRDPAAVELWNLLDILFLCGDWGRCEPSLPFWLVEELLDSQTTDACRAVFDYLESRRERFVQRNFFKIHLGILRSCNELLRRLSRAEDAVFCGRVFFFLFQTFPLGDKSSVNLRGAFHVENDTTYDKASSESEESAFYTTFWRLQDDFSDPTRLFAAENLAKFRQGLETTIAKFKATPVVAQTKSVADPPKGVKRKREEQGESRSFDQFAAIYNPKYLTSPELFSLELSDLAFQRHILVQSLIVIDFLLSLTPRAKQKFTDAAAADAKTINKSVVYAYTLSEEDEKWARSTRSTIETYLQDAPDGKFYYRMVNTVLARDKNWVRWKMQSCPSIVQPALTTDEHAEATSSLRRHTADRRVKAKPMGAIQVDFLTESAGDATLALAELKDPARYAAPTIPGLLKGMETDDLDLEMAMDDDDKQALETAKSSKTWRALRAATRSSLGLLDKLDPAKSVQEVLKAELAPPTSPAPAAGSSAPDGDAMVDAA